MATARSALLPRRGPIRTWGQKKSSGKKSGATPCARPRGVGGALTIRRLVLVPRARVLRATPAARGLRKRAVILKAGASRRTVVASVTSRRGREHRDCWHHNSNPRREWWSHPVNRVWRCGIRRNGTRGDRSGLVARALRGQAICRSRSWHRRRTSNRCPVRVAHRDKEHLAASPGGRSHQYRAASRAPSGSSQYVATRGPNQLSVVAWSVGDVGSLAELGCFLFTPLV
jgi:hypothetical protein